MGISILLESMTTAVSVGVGCGTCCGSGISAALYAYLTTHIKDLRQMLVSFGNFVLGKSAAVVGLCVAASIMGKRLIDDSGNMFGINLAVVTDSLMLITGLVLLFGWLRNRIYAHNCKGCTSCGSNEELFACGGAPSQGALFGMGVGYGLSPCAPLILITGYAATLTVGHAVVLGFVFALMSMLSPMLMMLVLSGVLGTRLRREIPHYLVWFQLGCYIVLIAIFSYALVKEVMGL
jgi:hypothetical protein